ncbi:MAG: lamin tail domain-containing protein [Sedimentisphaerales bacterium]|nr:lamin tail domain-containing protein [Sedimentisphaerales bacterium]
MKRFRYIKTTLIVLIATTCLGADPWPETGIPLVINEFMASNTSIVKDPQDQYDDWIELYNAGTESIDLASMYLTDNLDQPAKWRIPSLTRGTTLIAPGGYLLIWADGDTADAGLHANFKLDADGEDIGLFDSDGETLIHSVTFPRQTPDISYGCYPDANDIWRFLSVPTPGAQNDGAYLGEVEAPKFSHERGFYNRPFSVTLATETEGATIYYTLDGSKPFESGGRFPEGLAYTNPVYISETTCLRARAIKTGFKPSKIVTYTYLVNASEELKSLPLISLVADERQTFYEPDGIMAIVGGTYSSDGTWVADGPNSYNNPIQRGIEYERPVSYEWIEPLDNSGFQVNCGIRVHGSNYMRPRYHRSGGYWTGNSKFAFRLYFRGEYGPSWLEHPLFPFDVERFKAIVLRAGHNDRTNPFIKDELLRRLHKDMGQVDSGGTMANLLINGEYKGYYNPCEHIKDSFCQEWYNSDKEWDVTTMNGIRDGDVTSWNEMINYARSHDLSDSVYYSEMGKRLDIPAFADYLILQLWSGNWDWPQNNWAAACERSEEGRWRFFIWDAEGGMYSDRLSIVYFDRLNSQNNENGYLYRALKNNSTFRQLFADRIQKHLFNNGALTESNIRERFMELRDEMVGVISNMDMYVLNTWVPTRLDIFLDACASEGVFTFEGPTFNINNTYQHGGHVSPGDTLTLKGYGRLYDMYYALDGSDPYFMGLPNQGSNAENILVAENADKRVVVPVRPLGDIWRNSASYDDSLWLSCTGSPGGVGFEKETGFEGLISLDIAQRMYGVNSTCYIRIPFTFGGNVDNFNSMILNIRYDDGFIAYLNGTEIARRNFSGTPASDSSAGVSRDDTEAAEFESIDCSAYLNLVQQGSNLLAIHGLNSSKTDSDFLISAELFLEGENSNNDEISGATLFTDPIELTRSTHVKARLFNGRIWSALTEATFAVGPVAENLRITELMYHPQALTDAAEPNEEFIELTNIGNETINLNLVRFTNGIDFTFPDIELAPGQFIVIVEDRDAFEARYSNRFRVVGQYSGKLDNAGERITLEDAAGQTILDFNYSDGWRSLTDGEGFSLTMIDPTHSDPSRWDEKDAWRASASMGGSPGHDDSGFLPNPGDVVINELLANSPDGEPDWIELHNTTGTAIDIGGWFLSDNPDNPFKYEIASGTAINPYGYIVFYEDLHFGNSNDIGSYKTFALSNNGEQLTVQSAQSGNLTGYRETEDFSASTSGTSIGRYDKSSTGNTNFVAMELPTPGMENAYPKVGPIVMSEIMYNPDWPQDGVYTNDQYEYIELHNISTEPVTLYDFDMDAPWKFTRGIDYTFPTDSPVTIPAGGFLLVVKHPEAFLWRYPRVRAEMILGPYDGKLSDAGESIEIGMPGERNEEDELQYIRIDRINYSDGSHPEDCPGFMDLWPVEADGSGRSLTRRTLTDYGNDPANWQAAIPFPGSTL